MIKNRITKGQRVDYSRLIQAVWYSSILTSLSKHPIPAARGVALKEFQRFLSLPLSLSPIRYLFDVIHHSPIHYPSPSYYLSPIQNLPYSIFPCTLQLCTSYGPPHSICHPLALYVLSILLSIFPSYLFMSLVFTLLFVITSSLLPLLSISVSPSVSVDMSLFSAPSPQLALPMYTFSIEPLLSYHSYIGTILLAGRMLSTL